MVSLAAELAAARSLLDFSRRLGRVCLRERRLLAEQLAEGDIARECLRLERTAAAGDPLAWQQPGPQGGFAHLLDLDDVVVRGAAHPVEHLAVLRGLARRALPLFYERADGRVLLDEGTPIPFVSRPIPGIYDGPVTPSLPTLARREPLADLGFNLFAHPAGDIRVVLDYSRRQRLDELTWSGDRRLPRIATLHPYLGEGGLRVPTYDSRFFDVVPENWTPAELLAGLRAADGAELAVLAELCLPTADALQEALEREPERYPPLVVAGSAHVRESRPGTLEEIRANESRVYLDGELVLRHRKIHALETRTLGNRRFEHVVREDITGEPKEIVVLSGDHTRLAVVICADLNDTLIPNLLEDAGVNLLLVPALTYHAGAFTAAVSDIASRCQGVALVANADLEPVGLDGRAKAPFLVLAGIPRPDPQAQLRSYPDPAQARFRVGVFDPNLELGEAMRGVDDQAD